MSITLKASALACFVLLTTQLASADTSVAYSLPWQLRSATNDNVIRIEGAAAVFNDSQGNVDIANIEVLSGSYRLTERWSPTLRLGFVGNNAPGAAYDGASLVNPAVGMTYARTIRDYKLSASWSTTIPTGSDGRNASDPRADVAAAAMTARPVDSAMFEVNYMTETLAIDAAYVSHGLTAQAELSLAEGIRARGSDSATGADAFRTSAAVALHLGYFIGSHVSVGADVRYQRWLSERAHMPMAEDDRDTLTAALGVRAHVTVGGAKIHPGLSLIRGFDARGFDAPIITAQTTSVQIDVPVVF